MDGVLNTGREGNFKEWRKFSEPIDSKNGGAVILILLGSQGYMKTILDGQGELQVNDRVPCAGCILLFQEVS